MGNPPANAISGFGQGRIRGLAYSCRRGDGNPVLSWLLAGIASRHSVWCFRFNRACRQDHHIGALRRVAGSTYFGQAGHSPPRSEPHDWQQAHHAGWDAGVAVPFRLIGSVRHMSDMRRIVSAPAHRSGGRGCLWAFTGPKIIPFRTQHI